MSATRFYDTSAWRAPLIYDDYNGVICVRDQCNLTKKARRSKRAVCHVEVKYLIRHIALQSFLFERIYIVSQMTRADARSTLGHAKGFYLSLKLQLAKSLYVQAATLRITIFYLHLESLRVINSNYTDRVSAAFFVESM